MKTPRIALFTSPLLLALALAGCDTAEVDSQMIRPGYSPSMVWEAMKGGGLPLVVHGGATAALDQQATQDLIEQTVSLPRWTEDARFTTGSAADRFRVVLIFNPVSIGQAADGACGPLDDIATQPPGDKMHVVAAFCDDDEEMSSENGSIGLAGDPGEAVDRLVTEIALTLMPSYNRAAPRRG